RRPRRRRSGRRPGSDSSAGTCTSARSRSWNTTDCMIGSQIGPYRIDGLLGRGGMGEVYRAFDVRLGRSVALKMLPEAKRSDPAIERFLREARAASALNHPNIVTVHEIGETESGAPYMVQELVDGRTLRSELRPSPL